MRAVLLAVVASVLVRTERTALLSRGERGCELPEELNSSNTNEGWSFLATGRGAVLLSREPDDSDELGLLVFDCKTQKQLLFLHIPKNAGTTIEDVATTKGVAWGRRQLGGQQTLPDGSVCNRWHIPPAYLPFGKDANPYVDSEVFCVTRHPYDRAVSEYKYLNAVEWGNDKPIDPRCTIQGLNGFLSTTMMLMKTGKKFLYDCHMVPQNEFVWGPTGRQWCQHTLKIEGLTQSFNTLMTQKGFGIRLGVEKKNSKAGVCATLSTQSLTPLTKSQLNEVYAADFQRLGYQPW